tara:strand:+ start:18038 stop:18517 length:480 start_codon:yes stop_codon:yes gene_type:complete
MQSPETAPKDRRFLAKIVTYGFDRVDQSQKPVGHRIVECFWKGREQAFRIWLGREGYTTTEPCEIVGWWPLPGDAAVTVDLSGVPDGWWLYGLFHNHTPIKYRDETHVPFDQSGHGEPWTCKLQAVTGGLLTEGEGLTPQQAVDAAVTEVELRHMEPSE